ncbi:MAG: hypothetical protein GKR90_05675 [Pseudomonadales bacterium]|nr:hypothetical protein [Pseudomonadales bacterium]
MSNRYYNGQFAALDDLLIVAIPQTEIVDAMISSGEQETLNSVCLAVAVVADAIGAAQTAAIEG